MTKYDWTPEGPKQGFTPSQCGCYTWKHEGEGCEMRRLWKLNAELVEALKQPHESLLDEINEHRVDPYEHTLQSCGVCDLLRRAKERGK